MSTERIIVLGAGLAGLTAALELAPRPVTLISPYLLGEGCSSAWAQGGIAAAVGEDDDPALHVQDTLAAGAYLNDEDAVRRIVGDAPAVIARLAEAGVPFDRDSQGKLARGLEAAHSRRRIVHAADATGLAVVKALIARARATPSIEIIENAAAQDVIVEDGAVVGVVLTRDGQSALLPATQVVLATGGAVALWRDTTNPHGNWGSGLALALRAGATLADLEFVQFHPTAIDVGQDPMPLASEAVRGEGVKLILENGERFTDELQPRDIVARAIWREIVAGHRVFLDTPKMGEAFARRFPTVTEKCRAAGIDPVHAPIPVRPAAHYHMGGVAVDEAGRTGVEGLWACGEVACTGLHGANRLASNSLLEAASCGRRVAQDISGQTPRRALNVAARLSAPEAAPDALPIREIMSREVGVVRDRAGLQRALDFLAPRAAQSDMALVGLAVARAALAREESRGGHYRSDFPDSLPTPVRSAMTLADLRAFLS